MATDFGTDIAGDTDLTPTLLNASGVDLLKQVCVRRLITPTGSLLSSPSAKTIDLRDYLSAEINRDGSGTGFIRTAIVQALVDDERISSVSVTLSFDPNSQVMTVGLAVVSGAGPFQLTLAVSAVTVEVLS